MKLRNKKTGEIWKTAVINSYACGDGYRLHVAKNPFTSVGNRYGSLAELNEEWEDYTEPTAPSKYYLINEETGYVLTFDSEDEMSIFEQEVKGWRQIKILLDGEEEE